MRGLERDVERLRQVAVLKKEVTVTVLLVMVMIMDCVWTVKSDRCKGSCAVYWQNKTRPGSIAWAFGKRGRRHQAERKAAKKSFRFSFVSISSLPVVDCYKLCPVHREIRKKKEKSLSVCTSLKAQIGQKSSLRTELTDKIEKEVSRGQSSHSFSRGSWCLGRSDWRQTSSIEESYCRKWKVERKNH